MLHSGGGPKSRYLFREALLYYACAKSATMNFVELFAELAPYMPSPKRRFGLVTRIKRGLLDQSLPGGSGKAQVYFEGALTILRRDFDVDDLRLLYSGRLMLSEMDRVRRELEESSSQLQSALRASEMMVVGSGMGIRAVGTIDGRTIGRPQGRLFQAARKSWLARLESAWFTAGDL